MSIFQPKAMDKTKGQKAQSKQAPVWQGDARTGRLGFENNDDQHVKGANGKIGIHAESRWAM